MKSKRDYHLLLDRDVFAQLQRISRESGITINDYIISLISKEIDEKKKA